MTEKLRPLHAIKQATATIGAISPQDEDIVRFELRTAHEVLHYLIEGARMLKDSRPPHMCYRNKKERAAYERLEWVIDQLEKED